MSRANKKNAPGRGGKKGNKDEDSVNDLMSMSDDGLDPDEAEVHQEYSDEYYKIMRAQLKERLDDDAADRCIRVHKKANEKKLTQAGKMKAVILGGKFEIKTWYDGCYPEHIAKNEKAFICDGCFMYFADLETWQPHAMRCRLVARPPGMEVYRDKDHNGAVISVWMMDGYTYRDYCQLLSQFAMLFLKDKCVFLNGVEEFDYFVVTEHSEKSGFRPVGYFSRQRIEKLNLNLNCFCVFPCYQARGFGRFIIDFSYKLSMISGTPGGPEKPFSAFGAVSYSSYWKSMILKALRDCNGEIAMDDLVRQLGMRMSDILEVIDYLFNEKPRKTNEIVINESLMGTLAAKETAKDSKRLYSKREKFSPYLVKYMEDFNHLMQVEDTRRTNGMPTRKRKPEEEEEEKEEKTERKRGRRGA